MTAPARIKTSYMAHRDGERPADDDPLLAFAPVPLKQVKKNSLTPGRQRAFIAELAATGIVTDAARAVGASQEAFYRLRNLAGAEEFRAAWEAAVDRAMARVETSAVARAIDGEERMVVSGGKVLGTERRHNEALVTFLLRSRRPDRYGQDWKALKPGHPIYEQIRREVYRQYPRRLPHIEDVRAEILRKVEAMERAEACQSERERRRVLEAEGLRWRERSALPASGAEPLEESCDGEPEGGGADGDSDGAA